ncbi:hypothetical protein BDV95DRAFT_489053 [Massariosphaeria phaeospora]|uniref:Signal peptide-containing protein n=1 Tax=Massariosphaeria phaeospora TaxID=100035 RepID=A0A7C8IG22_9PLEO|nr:hypothetical protein BDV95DRAFT_489053 [Massariosphaeria phaeospora]
MSWFLKGVQSAVFHYLSCTPCTGYGYRRNRRKHARLARKAKEKLQLERPELYHHPEPTGTNPYWGEEILMGPGPPPRRGKRTNTGSQKGIARAGTHSTVVSQGGSSMDVERPEDMRLSDETLDDDNWNHKRYQREDENLWGFDEAVLPADPVRLGSSGSSVGVAGLSRPGTSRSESYYSVRAPPVNDLHPPVVSLPSPHPLDNRWMLQPPPKASVMSGKERATNRSRSGSGASSRVELSLQRQVSARQLEQKFSRGETPELPPLSRMSSYSNLIAAQRHDRPRTPQARPLSAASSRKKTRRDTAITRTFSVEKSSGDSSDAVVHRNPPTLILPGPDAKAVRNRTSRPHLSTVISGGSTPSLPRRSAHHIRPRRPLVSSDRSSLNVLQNLVCPRDLLKSRFVSAPLLEARISLPPSDRDEETMLSANKEWIRNGFTFSPGGDADFADRHEIAPFDGQGGFHTRDPRMRWSVDF